MQTALLIAVVISKCLPIFQPWISFLQTSPMLHTKHYPRNSALSLLADEILLLCSNCRALNSHPPANFMFLQGEYFFLK